MCCRPEVPVDADAISLTDEDQLSKVFANVILSRARLWMFKLFEKPTSSVPAKVLAVFSIGMILVSFLIMVCHSMEPLCPRTTGATGSVRLSSALASASVSNDSKLEVLVTLDADNLVDRWQLLRPVMVTNETNVLTGKTLAERLLESALRLEECPQNLWLAYLNILCVLWFTFELLTRFLISPRKCHFLRAWLNVIDWIAILPAYLEVLLAFAGNQDLGVVRLVGTPPLRDTRLAQPRRSLRYLCRYILLSMRTLRVLRVLKLARYSDGLRKFGRVLGKSKMQLLTAGIISSRVCET